MGPIEISSYILDDLPIVEVGGDIDMTNVLGFDTALVSAAATDFGAVVVSLENVSYLDTRGMHSLMDFIKRLDASRQRLFLVAPSNLTARRILSIMGIDKRAPSYETLSQAIEHAKKHVAEARQPNGSEDATA